LAQNLHEHCPLDLCIDSILFEAVVSAEMDQQLAQRVNKLDEVLNRLPYQYSDKPRLRSDLVNLLQTCPSLLPELNTFSGSGRQVTLIYLAGVIPISYSGATYNIPVTIYFDPPYPKTAPRCFVTPTEGMALKANHPNVDQGGMIYLPYLSTWAANTSRPSELMTFIASAFSAQPPVYAKTAAPAVQPQAVARATATPSQGYPVAVAKAVPVAVAKAVALSPHEQAVRGLTDEAKKRWGGVLEPIIKDINDQAKRKAELQNASDKVDQAIASLERETTENQAKEAELQGIEAQLQTFVAAHAGREPDPDTLKDSLDQESRLVLDLLAEEMSMEEYLAALDELLESRKISMEDFLREVRDVSREQFKLRACRLKAARTLCSAGPVAAAPPMAASAPPMAASAPPMAAAVPIQRVAVPS